MSVERIYGTQAASTELDDYIFRMREAVGLIVAHTPAVIESVVTNTEEAYDCILHIGTDRYAELSAAINGSAVTVTISIGYFSGGRYVATNTGSQNVSTRSTPWRTVLTLINGGDMWILSFWPNNGFYARFVKIRSSIDGAIHWSAYFYAGSSTSYISYNFPTSHDYYVINNAEVSVGATYTDAGGNNVPTGTMLMFPTILYVEQSNNLGFPTVGNQIPYSMSARTASGIDVGEEFTVERQRFVSLGYVAVRSV